MKINLILETSPEYFCNWLKDFTRDAPCRKFLTEKGSISLQTARPTQYGFDRNRYMCMEGFYLTRPKDNSQSAYPIPSIIEFKIIPLNPNRIEIIAKCNQPVIKDYFESLLEEINKRWSPKISSEQQISELHESFGNHPLK